MKLIRFNGGRIGIVENGCVHDVTAEVGEDPQAWPPIEGRGQIDVDGEVFACERGDIIAVPIWKRHSISSVSGARLLQVSDEPVQRALGLYRSEGCQ
jgi:gentisate 1,2-dioxygenase